MKRPALTLVLVFSLMAAGCGGTSATSAPVGSSGPAPTAALTSGSSPASTAQPAVGDGPALCAFLTTEIPLLRAAGSTGGAVAQLAIDYADWIGKDPARGLPDAAVMDTLTKASCPQVRDDVLKLIGSDSFANGL